MNCQSAGGAVGPVSGSGSGATDSEGNVSAPTSFDQA